MKQFSPEFIEPVAHQTIIFHGEAFRQRKRSYFEKQIADGLRRVLLPADPRRPQNSANI
jgi:hypothetical protein